MTITMGMDIGQRSEPSALCVAEIEERPGPRGSEVHYLVRHLERLPIGTNYPTFAGRAAEVASGVRQRAGSDLRHVYLDATGVGQSVVDLFGSLMDSARVVAVYFTHGDRRLEIDGEIRLGKAYLVGRLQTLLQVGGLHLPKIPDAEALAKDLLDYEIRVSEDANDRYGAFRVGPRDDLITALGLAAQPKPPGPGIY